MNSFLATSVGAGYGARIGRDGKGRQQNGRDPGIPEMSGQRLC